MSPQFVPNSKGKIAFADVSVIKALLERGADCNVTDHDGVPPLVWASNFGDENVVRLLLEHGANVNAIYGPKEHPCTALLLAAWSGQISTVRLLLAKGADIRRADNDSLPILEAFSFRKAPDLLRRALAAGVDVNTTNTQGGTALISAVQARQVENVKILLDAGAKVNIKDKRGKTAMQYAMRYAVNTGNGTMVALLKEAARREAVGKKR